MEVTPNPKALQCFGSTRKSRDISEPWLRFKAEKGGLWLTLNVYIYICMSYTICTCLSVHIYTYVRTHIYIYIYMWLGICPCGVCKDQLRFLKKV